MTPETQLLNALAFAAAKHRDQRRKDAEASPYINHPIALAQLLATTGGVTDPVVLQAAVLHDTVEDTDTSLEELTMHFGPQVAAVVAELTDDKTLPKAQRKALQVEHAPHKSPQAALVKLADKTCNLRDIIASPPADWPLQRRRDYFDWALQVVQGLPAVSPALRAAFDAAYAQRAAMNSSALIQHHTLRVATPHHLHEVATHHAALVAVVHGVKQVFAGGRVQRFAAGTLVLMPGGLRWEIANTPGDNGWYVAEVLVLSPEVLSRFGQQFAAQCAAARVTKGAVGLTLAGDLADAFERVTAVATSDASVALRMHRALELLLLLVEAGWAFAAPQAQRWAERVQALVAHQPDSPWTLAEMAARLALGPSSLQRRLREEGSTLQACVRQGRMDAALGLLQTTDWPVSQVALACGYASHGRFSGAFAQRFGVPPSHLRAGP